MAILSGCKKDDEPTCSVEVNIPGMVVGNYNKFIVQMQYFGETGIKGLYATRFHIYMKSSDDVLLVIDIDAFHDSKSFAPGTYKFPSTGVGTATGRITHESSGNYIFSGEVVSGQVSIAVSRENYTVTFNNVSMKTDDGTKPVSFVYKGPAEYWGSSGRETLNPDYPGSSNIRETVSGTTFPHMRMDAFYIGFDQHYSSHSYYVYLTSLETGGVSSKVFINIFSDTRDMKGLYFATIAGMDSGRFIGNIMLEGNGEKLSKPTAGGQVTIAESNGVYTITLYNVTDRGYGYKESMNFHGTYTGICSFF
jgi:hypothetical protein